MQSGRGLRLSARAPGPWEVSTPDAGAGAPTLTGRGPFPVQRQFPSFGVDARGKPPSPDVLPALRFDCMGRK